MAKMKNAGGTAGSAPWQKRRREQGYSFTEVLREVRRRARGEYVLPLALRDEALRSAERSMEIQFKLAALLSDFLRDEHMSSEELVALLDCDAGDTIDFVLDPFPRSAELANVTADALIDHVYPGKFFSIDRDRIGK